ncbi:restriction endonuclease subunit S [Lactobacillus crispatus]|uniref:restriction endonuclease subunit S n=1 Tax=Lactobacillus TaxID=1578 RepID=UPI000B5D9E46|nr:MULTISPECIES: restriction endonuclease subunit S [Lactobacillus]PEG83703.1 restriction endonuclease subunit S [Lactobacillus sp. UMNPBX16]PEG99043.1 restriction endonuclease subunit S [Lactobacillus sp. UMNPBX8]
MKNNRHMELMSNLIESISMGPFGSDVKVEYFTEKGIPFLSGENLTSIKMNDRNLKYFPEEKAEKLSKAIVYPGDIVVTHRGTLGQLSYVPDDLKEKRFLISQSQFKVTLKKDLVNPVWFAYYFHTKEGQKRLLSFANYVGVPALATATTNFKGLEIPLPKRAEQDKIADFLSNIDSKIANNNAISKELESMAKTIYDYWFLQFEFPDKDGKPYKSNGGKMVWNDQLKQEIPEGWEVDNLYRIADFINGIASQKYRPVNIKNKLPVIKITEMHDGFTSKTEFVRDDIDDSHIIHNGDILFSWSASLETMIWNKGLGGLNQHIFKVIPKADFSKHYVYQQLSSYVINFVLMANARKTTMGHITKDHLEQSRITIPPKNLRDKFESMVESLYSKITVCDEENQELKSLRDFLLPMLMNGQVTIKD